MPKLRITPGLGRIILIPGGFRLWAQHYLKCRRDFRSPDSFSPVPYFLVCRAIELELKARHLEKMRVREVKDKFGHDLLKAYDVLPKSAQVLSKPERAALQKASGIYKTKGFEYFSAIDAVKAFGSFSDLTTLDRIANLLVPNAA